MSDTRPAPVRRGDRACGFLVGLQVLWPFNIFNVCPHSPLPWAEATHSGGWSSPALLSPSPLF